MGASQARAVQESSEIGLVALLLLPSVLSPSSLIFSCRDDEKLIPSNGFLNVLNWMDRPGQESDASASTYLTSFSRFLLSLDFEAIDPEIPKSYTKTISLSVELCRAAWKALEKEERADLTKATRAALTGLLQLPLGTFLSPSVSLDLIPQK